MIIEQQQSVSLFHSTRDETVKQEQSKGGKVLNKPATRELAIDCLKRRKMQQATEARNLLSTSLQPEVNVPTQFIDQGEIAKNELLQDSVLSMDNSDPGKEITSPKISHLPLNEGGPVDYVAMAKRDFDKPTYELFEERAAIMEFDGRVTKYVAEERAYSGTRNQLKLERF
jgi:hypothetical protein